MLMALLYTAEDTLAAAAPACDQVPHGDRYWFEYHPAELDMGNFFETAYVTVANRDLQNQLLQLGISDEVDGATLAQEVLLSVAPDYTPSRAA